MATAPTVGSEAQVQLNIEANIAVKQAMLADGELLAGISAAAEMIAAALRGGHRVMLMGNGGSAADAQHIAAEFVGRYRMQRRALPVMALTVNTSALTAISNDYSFDDVFTRQVEAFARPGDVLIGITTSGNSRNILRAFLLAAPLKVQTVALTGGTGGRAKSAVNLCLRVPSDDTPRIQEAHILIGHAISEIVEADLFRR
jgi:D-sedoheptulose 7-phosphate isomerase